MAQIYTKAELLAINQVNFPDNNSGLITPVLMRNYNTASIDSMVDETQYNADSASFASELNSLVASGSGVQIIYSGSNLGTVTQLEFTGSVTASVSGSVGTIFVPAIAGASGTAGTSGTSGTSGQDGQSNTFFNYQAKTTITTGNPLSGHIIWNTATQASASSINVSDIDENGNNTDIFLGNIPSGSVIVLQDQASHTNYQRWQVGTGVDNSTYWTFPVTLIQSTHSSQVSQSGQGCSQGGTTSQ